MKSSSVGLWTTGPVPAHSGLDAVIRADDVLQDAHVSSSCVTAVSIRQEVRQQDNIMHRVSFQNKGSTLYQIISHVVYILKYEVNDLNLHTRTEYVEFLQHASTPSASGLTLMVCVVLYVWKHVCCRTVTLTQFSHQIDGN